MRHHLLFLLLLLLPATAHATGLSLSMQEPRLEGEGLDPDALFARVDSLEAQFGELEGVERARCAHRLAQLYLSTDLFKHRRRALGYLDRALEADPTFFDAARLRADTAHHMRYTGAAEEWFQGLAELRPEDPRGHQLLGRYYFSEARALLDPVGFGKAKAAFLRAVAADSTQLSGSYGWAVSALALEQYEEVLRAVRPLLADPARRSAGLFLAGAAHVALGKSDLADAQMNEAIQRSDEGLRRVFLGADGVLRPDAFLHDAAALVDRPLLEDAMRQQDEDWRPGDEIDLEKALGDHRVWERAIQEYWRGQQRWPTQIVNRRQLEFWRRLVEADVLFGDPDRGVRGWNTVLGHAMARWGRPEQTHYEAPSAAIDFLDWQHRGIRLRSDENIPAQAALWVWTYRRPGIWFSLLFTDPTLQRRWLPGSASAELMARIEREHGLLFEDAPLEEPGFRVALTTAVFPRSEERSSVENYLQLSWTDEPDGEEPAEERAVVEWAIYDGDGRRVEYLRRELDERYRRENLHRALALAPPAQGADQLLWQVGARLEPGQYRLAVDVTAEGRGHRAAEIYLRVPHPHPPGILALSDLQLASTFAPWQPEMDVPGEFVKYARGVLPVPDAIFSADRQRLHVFFEVYNLRVDETAQTRFNVSYRVYRRPKGVRPELWRIPTEGDDVLPDPASLTFVEESTAVSEQQHVVKSGEVDISRLEPGHYMLVVEIEDLLAGQSVSRSVPFSRAGEEPDPKG